MNKPSHGDQYIPVFISQTASTSFSRSLVKNVMLKLINSELQKFKFVIMKIDKIIKCQKERNENSDVYPNHS